MFVDWLDMYQDHDCEIAPRDGAYFKMDAMTGEYLNMHQPAIQHEGSFDTSIQVVVSGSRVRVSGNPSRFNRPDNLFGFARLDDAVAVFNQVLLALGYPPFTKGTTVLYKQSPDGTRTLRCSDGAVFTRVDLTENRSVGEGNTVDYLRAVSTQSLRRSVPQLYSNGRTVEWKSQKGNARQIYPKLYDKANELRLHALPDMRRKYGTESREYRHIKALVDYCESNGVVRFEQELKSEYLRKNRLNLWGLFDPADLEPVHNEFLSIDDRLQVEAMTLENISERLIRLGICDGTRAANTTAMYAIQWMTGQRFDLGKSAVKTHRARLRKIGIDIGRPCDLSRHSTVYVVKAKRVDVQPLPVPDWYELPKVNHLRAVA